MVFCIVLSMVLLEVDPVCTNLLESINDCCIYVRAREIRLSYIH